MAVSFAVTVVGFAAAIGAGATWKDGSASVASEAAAPVAPAAIAGPSSIVAPRIDDAAQASPPPPASASSAKDRPPCPRLIVTFALASQKLSDKSRERVAEVARWLVAHPDATSVVDGHADGLGSDHANLDLSRRRAAAVAQIFEAEGVARSRLTVRGFGAFTPVEGVPDEAAANRRVVIQIRNVATCALDQEEVLEP